MRRDVQITNVITQVARKYARRSWWLDVDELVQEGWLQCLHAGVREVPDSQLKGWVATVTTRQLKRFIWRASAPVSGSRGERTALQGIRRESVEDIDPAAAENPEGIAIAGESTIALPKLRGLLVSRLTTLLAPDCPEVPNPIAGAFRVLLDGYKPRKAAAEVGCSVRDVYDGTARMKRITIQDTIATNILKEIRECRSSLN